ncbi:MAG: DUF1549 domain-containing protein, partial [Acidobacteria bacterium]|nr:DUF1549 domain-containing protein [Acidobacteriota bacterium]
VDFNRDIRPILSDTCFTCHGPDEASRMAGMRLDTREGDQSPFADRDGYRIIVPGNSSESRLYQKISAEDEAERMPPSFSNRTLTEKQIELIGEWIDQGARWETHWAFVPPERPPLPRVKDESWPRQGIDNFVLARLENEGLKPAHQAEKVILLRRVTLDLTGLPPTPAEVDAFLADPSPDAYERIVDRLLESPHFGERMAMHWLDLARYSDTHGFHIDSHRDMWMWRDWVIKAFNRNMPFDQFAIEQLAGDLLPAPTAEQRIATGFNRNHMINFEGGAIPDEYQNEYVVDRVETTATTWMGLTMGCARCHDHKYDPVRQKDFYRFYAFFNNVPEKGLDGRTGNAGPLVQFPSPEQRSRLEELTANIKATEKEMPEEKIRTLESTWEKTALSSIPIPPREDLLGHYEFEGHLADTSGHYHHGAVRRGKVTFSAGPVGNAVDFNGETQLELGDTAINDRADAFSLALWFNPGAKYAMTLLGKVEDSEARRGFEAAFDETEVMGIHKRAAHLMVRLIHRLPDDAIQIKTKERVLYGWRHLAINYDGSGKAAGLNLFLDGKPLEVEIIQDRLTGSIAIDSPLEIGNEENGKPYKGQIDDLRFYSRPLTVSEIEQLAVHAPIRARLASPSEACAEVDSLPKADEASESEKDPLAEQAQQDTPAYQARQRCLAEQNKLRDYFLSWAAPDEVKRHYAELKRLKAQKQDLD